MNFSSMLFLVVFVSDVSIAATWKCVNDFESQCTSTGCKVLIRDNYTPMSVTFSELGKFSVCAYSGCWSGQGKVISKKPFLVILGSNIPWSSASLKSENILISMKRISNVAVVQAGSFYQAVTCKFFK